MGRVHLYIFARPDAPPVEEQVAAGRAYFETHLLRSWWSWAGEYIDQEQPGDRRKILERPEGARLAQAIDTGHLVLCARADCFYSPQDLIDTLQAWTRRGVLVHILDLPVPDLASPEGKLVLAGMEAAVAWEQQRRTRPLRRNNDRAAREGRACSGIAPLGTRQVTRKGRKRLVPDERARALMGRMLGWYRSGMPASQIAAYLHEQGERRKHGRPYTGKVVQGMIEREMVLQAIEAARSRPQG